MQSRHARDATRAIIAGRTTTRLYTNRKRHISQVTLWAQAARLAWNDPAGGRFTTLFTQRVLRLAPILAADDALIPLTGGLAAPVTLADNLVLLIGGCIYASKVRKYKHRLDIQPVR
jgi:hypothetical protein